VHPEYCNGCGVCVDVCPFDCISPSSENLAAYLGKVEVNEKTCVGCKLCEEVCGWEGIYIMTGKDKAPFLESLGYAGDDQSRDRAPDKAGWGGRAVSQRSCLAGTQ